MNQQLIKHKLGYQFKPFLELGVFAAFSNRQLDFSSKDINSQKNISKFFKEFKFSSSNLVLPEQVHGTNIAELDQSYFLKKIKTKIPQTDILVSSCEGVSLGVLTADCLSIFVFDEVKKIIAIIHAGWKGTRFNIVHNALMYLKRRFKTKFSDLHVGLGPCIRSCCYEVGSDLLSFFPDHIKKRDNKLYLDLIRANRLSLENLGVSKEKIYDSNLCTSCNPDTLFYHRLEKASFGRMLAVISRSNI